MLSALLRLSVALTTVFSLYSFADVKIGNDAPSSEEGHRLFSHYVIDTNIPEIAISSFAEHEHLVALVTKEEIIDGHKTAKKVYVVRNTDVKGNISAQVKYSQEQNLKNEDYIKPIEAMIRTQYKLRKFVDSFDPKSVRVTELDNGTDRIQFRYSKYGLPQDIAYFRFMEVEVIAQNGQPLSIRIVNSSPFEYENVNIEHYQQEIQFNQDR
ncbi:hypothetical protein L2735_07185, partial [Shewanella olleyana]|uniref:hypothetical protein n=1 Tax=Shewanella olleyana TaxID=135626 RepID=UPI00200FBB7E